jgi:hypothetical protein
MPKAIKPSSSTPFHFARQFTAPPFFVGLEDAKLKGRLLLSAMAGSRKGAAKPKAKKVLAKKSLAKKGRAGKK